MAAKEKKIKNNARNKRADHLSQTADQTKHINNREEKNLLKK